jgi:hypothetical protein
LTCCDELVAEDLDFFGECSLPFAVMRVIMDFSLVSLKVIDDFRSSIVRLKRSDP